MDYERIKKQANEILKSGAAECSYIEYKASALQLDYHIWCQEDYV